ncbi:MAG TPA: acetate kinase [Acidobacteriaceae bacterium]
MHILVLNPGSSSIKFSMFAEDAGEFRSLAEGELGGIGGRSAKLEFRDPDGNDLSGKLGEVKTGSMEEAIGVVERAVSVAGLPPPDAVGYRVVHPGPHLRGHQRLTPEVLAELRSAVPFAPLHDPEAIEIMEEMMRRFPGVPHFGCFDTVFHETMPEEATVYAVPAVVREQGMRRYGFHGLSCESIVVQMRAAAGVEFPRAMLIAHLGSGCSVTACVDGKSVDTTMGLTPTGGVVMGTRPGDIDPGVVIFLMRRAGATVDSVEAMLNHESGLKALGGVNDMRELRKSAAQGDQRAELATRIFCRGLVRAMAGLIALHGADAIVFTGGIGEHDAVSRVEIASGLARLGVDLDRGANQLERKELGRAGGQTVHKISDEDSPVAVYVAPAEEDLMIARHVARMCRVSPRAESQSS